MEAIFRCKYWVALPFARLCSSPPHPNRPPKTWMKALSFDYRRDGPSNNGLKTRAPILRIDSAKKSERIRIDAESLRVEELHYRRREP
ncbi:hypothetical protein AVEN_8621-1 [Araneus ventricosus]|uniref:Uncharacterized protein n=1 Tax=Araneus ventricosus TaxID=182803 RepID=A0A4Y2C3K4_ARAVE|nr:hypothetical protein AVEN_8621-1 [Araneus ventricosus]